MSTKRRKFNLRRDEDAPAKDSARPDAAPVAAAPKASASAAFATLFGGRPATSAAASQASPAKPVDLEDDEVSPVKPAPALARQVPVAAPAAPAAVPAASAAPARGAAAPAAAAAPPAPLLGKPIAAAAQPTPARAGASSAAPAAPQTAAPASAAPAAAVPAVTAVVAAPVSGSTLPTPRLEGKVFAFTGELEHLSRIDAEDLLKAAGAKVMGSVSGNTTYLVVGSRLEDGRPVEETSKYRKYLELKQKAEEKGKGKYPEVIDEDKLMKLLGKPAGGAAAPVAAGAASAAAATSSFASSAAPAPQREVVRLGAGALAQWVDAHAPQGFGELVGNASVVKKITEWLRDWDNVVLKGQAKKVPFKPGGGMPDNINARAILVSGPPGIGKTTTCRLAAQMHGGYEVLEFNASDARGQKVIQEMAEGIADNTTISFSGINNRKPAITKRAVIIMDEVDGMGSGDRGGNAALIKMIKKTRNPIMCICNDEHAQKIRTLAFSCYHLKFTRPTKANVAQRCAQIAQREGLQVEPNALEALAESCGSDMRMVLNQLQILARSPMYSGVGVKYTDMKQRLNEISKDQAIMLSPFDACKKLLNRTERERLSFRDRLEMFFVDHSLVGLLVQENILKSAERAPCDAAMLNRCAYAADLFTVGDIMNKRIATDQEWGLLPHVGVLSATYPSQVVNGFVAFPSFPQFLGKYSTMSKTRRLATELKTHVQLSTTVRRHRMVSSGYADLLYRRAVLPLVQGAEGAVDSSVAVLDAYGLRREHLAEHLTELRQHLGGDDLFKAVDSKMKAAMTRELNSGSHAMKVMMPTGKKRKAADPLPDEDGLGGEGEEAPENDSQAKEAESDDDATGGGLIKVKAKSKAKAKAGKAAAGSADGTASAKAKAKGKKTAKAMKV